MQPIPAAASFSLSIQLSALLHGRELFLQGRTCQMLTFVNTVLQQILNTFLPLKDCIQKALSSARKHGKQTQAQNTLNSGVRGTFYSPWYRTLLADSTVCVDFCCSISEPACFLPSAEC